MQQDLNLQHVQQKHITKLQCTIQVQSHTKYSMAARAYDTAKTDQVHILQQGKQHKTLTHIVSFLILSEHELAGFGQAACQLCNLLLA